MGSLRTLTILLTLGAWGAATDGARAEAPVQPGGTSSRPQPPVPPSEYIKAGIKLYNTGDARAAQYFKAANDYRDMLSPGDQARDCVLHHARLHAHPNAIAVILPEAHRGPRAVRGSASLDAGNALAA